MYSLLYRMLPGGKIAKVLQLVMIAMALIALLVLVVFPFVDSIVPQEPSVNG